MSSVIVIPARYASSRFPGKALAPIHGIPMILRVVGQAYAVIGPNVIVATDDERIGNLVKSVGVRVVYTDAKCRTGTDRVAEAVREIKDVDVVVSVQGDEPLVDPQDIRNVLHATGVHPINCWSSCGASEAQNPAVIKVVLNGYSELVYASRAVIPGVKSPGSPPPEYKKQVCIYGFTQEQLQWYAGRNFRGAAEELEDVEILRFMEHSEYRVRMIQATPTIAVDYPEDIPRVEAYLDEHEERE